MRKFAPWAAALVAALILAMAGALSADTPASPPDQTHQLTLDAMELPFTVPGQGVNTPVVHFKIDGTTDIALAIDTGTTGNVISTSLAAKLGLKPTPYLVNGKPVLVNGKPASLVEVSSLAAGPYNFAPVDFLTVDDKDFSIVEKASIDGIAGLALLRGMVLYIDYGRNKIAFFDSSGLTNDEIAQLGFHTDEEVIPLTVSDLGLYQVSVDLHNGPYSAKEDLHVDTGAALTSISHKVSDQLHLKSEGAYPAPTVSYGDISVDLVTVDSLAFGPLNDAKARILRLNEDLKGFPPGIGSDILSKGRVLLDFPAKKMYLAGPDTAPDANTTPPATSAPSGAASPNPGTSPPALPK